jgi:hypothetical protein
MDSRLPSEKDILKAISWRVSALPENNVSEAAELIFEASVTGEPAQIDEKALEIHSDSLGVIGDRREPFSLGCALVAWEAHRRQAWSVFWSAGFAVWQAWKQGKRGAHARKPDPLDDLIAQFRKNQPRAGALEAFEHFGDMTVAFHDVLSDFDGEALIYLHGKATRRIGFDAFKKRFARYKKGQQPVARKLAA